MFLKRRLSSVFRQLKQNTLPAPIWDRDIPEHWIGQECELKEFILSLSGTANSFLLSKDRCQTDPFGQPFQFDMKNDKNLQLIRCMLEADPRIEQRQRELVPDTVDEESFWRSYFYLVQVIKNAKRVHLLPQLLASLQLQAVKSTTAMSDAIALVSGGGQRTQSAATTPMDDDGDDAAEARNHYSVGSDFRSPLNTPSTSPTTSTCSTGSCLSTASSSSDVEQLSHTKRKRKSTCGARQKNDTQWTDTMIPGRKKRRKRAQVMQRIKSSDRLTTYIPELLNANQSDKSFTTTMQRCLLCRQLPPRLRLESWVLLYSTREHGTSMRTLLSQCSSMGEVLLFVQTVHGVIMGAFISEELLSESHYYGNGECFVFTFSDAKGHSKVHAFKWSKRNCCFVRSTEHGGISVGGDDEGRCSLRVESDLLHGYSQPCDTYNNSCLNTLNHKLMTEEHYDNENEHFDILNVEVWGFPQPKKASTKVTSPFHPM